MISCGSFCSLTHALQRGHASDSRDAGRQGVGAVDGERADGLPARRGEDGEDEIARVDRVGYAAKGHGQGQVGVASDRVGVAADRFVELRRALRTEGARDAGDDGGRERHEREA